MYFNICIKISYSRYSFRQTKIKLKIMAISIITKNKYLDLVLSVNFLFINTL